MFKKHKSMFKQMSMVAMAAETMAVAAAKHPEQKTKQSIKKLRASVNRAGLRKVLYEWPTVQLAFRTEIAKMKWPAAPEAGHLPPKEQVGLSVYRLESPSLRFFAVPSSEIVSDSVGRSVGRSVGCSHSCSRMCKLTPSLFGVGSPKQQQQQCRLRRR